MSWLGKIAAVLFSISFIAQEFIVTDITLSKSGPDNYFAAAHASGIMKIHEQHNELHFSVPLFTILTLPADNDSIRAFNKSVVLEFTGNFHASEFNTLDVLGNDKIFTVPGELRLNKVRRPYNLKLHAHRVPEEYTDSPHMLGYPVRVSFIIEVNPAEFHLDLETANFIEAIKIQTGNGVINRTGCLDVSCDR